MSGLEAVVTDHSEPGYANVYHGNPTLEPVVAGTMHPVGETNRSRSPSGFQACKARRVVGHLIGQQHLLSAARLHVAGGSVIHTAEDCDGRKQRTIPAVPESVRSRWL